MNLEELKNIFKNVTLDNNKIIISENLHDIVDFISSKYHYDILKEVTAVDLGKDFGIELIYHMFSSDDKEDLLLSITVQDSAESITDIFKSAIADENEIYDLFGINFTGNKNLKRLYMPEDWNGHPLKKDYVQDDTRLAWNDDNNA